MANLVKGIEYNTHVVKVVFRNAVARPSTIAYLYEILAQEDINALTIVHCTPWQGRSDIIAVIYESQQFKISEMRDELEETIGVKEIRFNPNVALITLYGSPEMAQTPGIALRVFEALQNANALAEVFAASADAITLLVKESRVIDALAELKNEFEIDELTD